MEITDAKIEQAIRVYEQKKRSEVIISNVKLKSLKESGIKVDFLVESKGQQVLAKDVMYSVDELSDMYAKIGPSIFAFDLSRIFKWYKDKNFGVLSAYLGSNSKEVNEQNQKELKEDVREKGYGYKEMLGVWRPDPDSPAEFEYSLFVPEMKPEDAIELGNKYNQYAVIYGDGENIILDFLGNEPNKVFDKFETNHENAWITWSEYKRHKYRFAGVEWRMPLPPAPTSFMEAQSLQAFLNPKECRDYFGLK